MEVKIRRNFSSNIPWQECKQTQCKHASFSNPLPHKSPPAGTLEGGLIGKGSVPKQLNIVFCLEYSPLKQVDITLLKPFDIYIILLSTY